MANTGRQLHALEIEFGLPAAEILDIINRRNRCKIAVRGAIAEAHLTAEMRRYRDAGLIDGFEDFDRDGYPDIRVDQAGRSFLLECKNVEKEKVLKRGVREPITVDFQRTRAPKGHPELRYYAPDEFQVLAACLWNRTKTWEFRYVAVSRLGRHALYPDRLSTHVTVGEPEGAWTADLPALLASL